MKYDEVLSSCRYFLIDDIVVTTDILAAIPIPPQELDCLTILNTLRMKGPMIGCKKARIDFR